MNQIPNVFISQDGGRTRTTRWGPGILSPDEAPECTQNISRIPVEIRDSLSRVSVMRISRMWFKVTLEVTLAVFDLSRIRSDKQWQTMANVNLNTSALSPEKLPENCERPVDSPQNAPRLRGVILSSPLPGTHQSTN